MLDGEEATLFSPFGIEIIPFIEKREFYRALFEDGEENMFDEMKNYVYLILNTRNGCFKIGRSRNPLKREKTLQAEEPEITLLKFWEADKKFERYLHSFFHAKKVRGEWFKLTIQDLLKLKKLALERIT